ncbi:hypothetical protein [Cryptosporangium arvum]|uniref:Uncharacterized protein n=1 Tax=Cryptosporangium arvum DSM 44712 TaxID=927661 RepID=A0A010ZRN3_9ACTN|nr:hypothetical protein [Cryptosporangium arvum]EXG79877.1 hypothetical protein CryarDRAFT_0928 [Cryptosporangium arvum DSM 44712]
MRTASRLHQSAEPCPHCRGGLVGADQWDEWFAQRDDAESAWAAEHGSLDGFDLAELLDSAPDGEQEVDCTTCAGTGLRGRRAASRRSHAA